MTERFFSQIVQIEQLNKEFKNGLPPDRLLVGGSSRAKGFRLTRVSVRLRNEALIVSVNGFSKLVRNRHLHPLPLRRFVISFSVQIDQTRAEKTPACAVGGQSVQRWHVQQPRLAPVDMQKKHNGWFV